MIAAGRMSTGTWLGGLAVLLSTIVAVAGWARFRGNGEAVEPRRGSSSETTSAGSPIPEVKTAELARSRPQPPPPARKEGRQVWAMLVGIENYQDPRDFPSCPNAARDAASMARWLIEEADWDPGNVLLLTDREARALADFKDPDRRPEHREPTRRELGRGIKEWLTPKVRPGDVVVFFFAGQAMSLPDKPDDRPGHAPRDYLVPWDARGAGIEDEGWRLGDEIEPLARRGDLSIVCLLDTSPIGRNRPPDRLGRPRQVEPALRSRMLEGIVRWASVTAWMAATDKPADAREGHGLLTRALLATIGSGDDRRNLQTCLHRIRRDPGLVGQGFRTVGGFGPELTLWPGAVRPRLPKADPLLQRGHSDQVKAVAFSTDGSRMFTASMDSTLRTWRDTDSLLLGVLPATTNGFWSLDLSGDGRLLVAGGGKGDLLFYDLEHESRKITAQAFPHANPVERVSVLHDGRHVVTIDNTGEALLWDAHTADVKLVGSLADGRQERALYLSAASRPGESGIAFAALVKKDDREVLRLFDLQGKVLVEQDKLPGPISALSLSDEGDRVVVGIKGGSVMEVELGGRGKAIQPPLKLADEPIEYLAIQPRWLVAGFGGSLQIIPVDKDHRGATLKLGEPIARVAFSADGRRVAARGKSEGRIRAWEVAADGDTADVLDLKQDDKKGDLLSLAFSPGGETLVAGDAQGGIRSWRIPSGEPRKPIAANRGGGIGHIAVAPDGKALLQVTNSGAAALWEFGERGNRGVWRIPGSFRPTGVFLPEVGGDLVLITDRGQLAVYDRDKGILLERRVFDQPTNPSGNRRIQAEFDTLSITAGDRGWVAAVSSSRSLACVWNVGIGHLVRKTIRDEDSGISNVVVCTDEGRLLLTAGVSDGRAKVWALGDAPAIPGQPQALAEAAIERVLGPQDPNAVDLPPPVTAAAFVPRAPGRIVLGRKDGQIEIWEPGAVNPLPIAKLQGRVAAIAFTPDGKYFSAAGDDRQIVVRETAKPSTPIQLSPRPNHYEQVNALAFWPGGRLLLSASDDATIRLWRVGDWPLLGTLASSADGAEWSVFTPNGLFDASVEGQKNVTWRLNPEDRPAVPEEPIVRLEQVFAQRHSAELAETLVTKAEVPEPPKLPSDPPPQITLEAVSPPKPKERGVTLRIRISKPGTTPRLYHNGVVVPDDLIKGDGQDYQATIALLGKTNRIYAMAGVEGPGGDQPAGIDGRSNELEFVYEGETPGRTHVLALGVSKYTKQSLRFAHEDARAIADFLQQNGIDGAPGVRPIVLRDEQVTRKAVDEAFETLRGRVKPEDTIVVFLAGHTAIRHRLFCLLLPTAEITGGPDVVALRALIDDPTKVQAARAPINDPGVLPYLTIQRQLSMVAALRRLVIIDACEAEAIFDDPAVRALNQKAIRQQAEGNAGRYRTSYILATRRGEREPEPNELEHGLLTYVLLRGMGAPNLRRPEGLKIFEQYPTADLDNDHWIETRELQRYAQLTVPVLAETFAGQPRRGGEAGAKASISPDFDQAASFTLTKVPGANP